MRKLTSTLTTAQETMGEVLAKVVLTHNGITKTYGVDTDNRILDLKETGDADRHNVEILIDNSDNTLTKLDLEGYKAVVSLGYHTSEDEYDKPAPLKVLSQQLYSAQGVLVCSLSLVGLPNELAEDKASEPYTPDSSDTNTIKDIINAIAKTTGIATMDCYNHCTSYTPVFDSEDTLIDTFIPADSFRINLNESRWAKIKELCSWTRCVPLVKNDGSDNAELHIFIPKLTSTATTWVGSKGYSLNDMIIPTTPNNYYYICTTAGTSGGDEPTWTTDIGDTISDGSGDLVWTVAYDYEYSLASGYHTFFSKSYRRRLVIPNYIDVSSHPSHSDDYSGYAEDTVSSGLIGTKADWRYMRLTGNIQAAAIAAAILQHHQVSAEKGSGFVPMNVGAEVYDYVKITDSREDDYREGNIGYFTKHYTPGTFEMSFGFGSIAMGGIMGTASSQSVEQKAEQTVSPTITEGQVLQAWGFSQAIVNLYSRIYAIGDELTRLNDNQTILFSNQQNLYDYLRAREEVIPKLHVTHQLIIPVKLA